MTDASPPLILKPTTFSYAFVPVIALLIMLAAVVKGLYYMHADWFILSLLVGGGGVYFFLDCKSERAILTDTYVQYVSGLVKPLTIEISLSAIVKARYFCSWVQRPFQAIVVTVRENSQEKEVQIPTNTLNPYEVQSFIDEINRRVAERQSL